MLYHIVFSLTSCGYLRRFFSIHGIGEEVIPLGDDLSIGPFEQRQRWWAEVFTRTTWGTHEEMAEAFDDTTQYEKIKDLLEEGHSLLIWCGPNACAEVGTIKLVSEFSRFSDQMKVLKIPKKEWKYQTHVPRALSEFNPEFDEGLFDLQQPLSEDMAQEMQQQWEKITADPKGVRLRTPQGIRTEDIEFYDSRLLQLVTKEWQSSAKVVGTTTALSDDLINDAFLFWRLRELVDQGKLVGGGKINFREYKVKLPQ